MKMKPKLIIPNRPTTPEGIAVQQEWLLINDLFVRWINNTTTPEDGILLLKYQSRLEDIKKSSDWQVKFQLDKHNWQLGQNTLNNPKSEGSN
jgi:hypothetical protein